MAIIITITKTDGLNESFSWTWDDATINRLIAYAKVHYPTINPDGTQSVPTDVQALRRYARGLIQGTRGNIRRWEKDTAIAAVAEPDPIEVV